MLSAQPDSLVSLDGYQKGSVAELCDLVLWKLQFWQSCDPYHRRFVCVMSMVSIDYNLNKLTELTELETLPTKSSRQNGKPLHSAMQFRLSSYTLDKYLAAIESDAFFRSVVAKFGI